MRDPLPNRERLQQLTDRELLEYHGALEFMRSPFGKQWLASDAVLVAGNQEMMAELNRRHLVGDGAPISPND
jgi:hypothetical protein